MAATRDLGSSASLGEPVDPQAGPALPPPGWYPDPLRRAVRRYWDGRGWTDDVILRETAPELGAPSAAPQAVRVADLEAFVDAAQADRVVDGTNAWRLRDFLHRTYGPRMRGMAAVTPVAPAGILPGTVEPTAAAPPDANAPLAAEAPTAGHTPAARSPQPAPITPSVGRPAPATPVPWTPPAAPPAGMRQPVAPTPAAPRKAGPLARWLSRTGHALRADLGANGLAYLGVLLLFVGVFGFVVFSNASLSRDWRPVNELAAPAVFAGAAWVLRRRAPQVAQALFLVAGGILPIMLVALFVDGATAPPDLHGTAVLLLASGLCLALAGAYAWRAVTYPASVLRFLVAPTAWLAVGFAAEIGRVPPVSGKHIASLTTGQLAAMAAAVAVTGWLTRLRRPHVLARGSAVAVAWACPVLALLLGLVAGAGAGAADVAAVPLTLLALVAAVESVGWLLPEPLTVGGELVLLLALGAWIGGAVGRELAGAGWWAYAGLLAVLALGGAHAAGRYRNRQLALFAVAAAAFLALATREPWPSVAAWSTVAVGAHALRLARPRSLPAPVVAAVAAVAPLAAAASLLARVRADVWLGICAGIVIAAALAAATWRRSDRFLAWWTFGAALLVAGSAAAVAGATGHLVVPAACAALMALAAAVSRVPVGARVWSAAAVVVEAAVLALAATTLATPWWPALLGGAGALLAIAVARDRGGASAVPFHLDGIGLLAGVVAIPLAWQQLPPLVVALACAALAWGVTAATEEAGRSTAVAAACRLTGEDTQAAPAVVRAAPSFVTVALAGGLVALVVADPRSSWYAGPAVAALVLAAAAAGLAVATRLLRADRPVAMAAAFWAPALGVLSLAWSAQAVPDRHAVVAGTALALAAVEPLTRPRQRSLVACWLAWPAAGTAAVEASLALGVPIRWVGWPLLGFWSAAALLAVGLDAWRAGPRMTPGWLRLRRLDPALALAGPAALVALFLMPSGARPAWASAALLVAVVVTVVAVVLRVGALGLVAAAAGAAALVGYAGPARVLAYPWVLLPYATALLALAVALAARPPQPVATGPAWPGRWDLSLSLAGHLAALAAVGLCIRPAVTTAQETWTLAAGALLAGGLAWVVPRMPVASGQASAARAAYLVAAAVLGLAAATVAGPGPRTVALALVTVAAAAGAWRTRGGVHVAALASAATAGPLAWVSLGDWGGWSVTTAVVATSLAGGGWAALTAVAGRWTRWRTDSILVSLVPAALALLVSATLARRADPHPAFLAVGGGLALAALASVVLAGRLAHPATRYAAVGLGLLAADYLSRAEQPAAVDLVWVGCLATVAGGALLLVLAGTHRGRAWRGPLLLVSVVAAAVALVAAGSLWPRHAPLVAATATAGALAVAAGASGDRRRDREAGLAVAVPLFAASLVVAAWDAFAGHAVWLLVPVGAALLAENVVLRAARRRDGLALGSPGEALLDIAAMVALALPALAESVRGTVAMAAVAVLLGILEVAWSQVTRVRRRLAGGAVTVLVGVLVLVGVPLTRLAASVPPAGLWLGLVALGGVAVAIAVFLEQARGAVVRSWQHLREVTRDWE